MGILVPILTSVIGTVAKGPNAKARAGAVAGGALLAIEPVVNAFMTGFGKGALPQIEQLGVIVGTAVAGAIIGYITVWLSPANGPKPPKA